MAPILMGINPEISLLVISRRRLGAAHAGAAGWFSALISGGRCQRRGRRRPRLLTGGLIGLLWLSRLLPSGPFDLLWLGLLCIRRLGRAIGRLRLSRRPGLTR